MYLRLGEWQWIPSFNMTINSLNFSIFNFCIYKYFQKGERERESGRERWERGRREGERGRGRKKERETWANTFEKSRTRFILIGNWNSWARPNKLSDHTHRIQKLQVLFFPFEGGLTLRTVFEPKSTLNFRDGNFLRRSCAHHNILTIPIRRYVLKHWAFVIQNGVKTPLIHWCGLCQAP